MSQEKNSNYVQPGLLYWTTINQCSKLSLINFLLTYLILVNYDVHPNHTGRDEPASTHFLSNFYQKSPQTNRELISAIVCGTLDSSIVLDTNCTVQLHRG